MRSLERTLGYPRADLRRASRKAGRFYKSFDIRAIGGSKWRHIDNPTDHLKVLQRRIKTRILDTVPLPDTMMGAVSGFSVLDNMKVHVRKPSLARIDLRDCFPRTNPQRVFRVFKEIFGCSEEIAGMLMKLTTLQTRLPVGAPTSSTLANLSLLGLHDELLQLAIKSDLAFSIWVDDIAFSGAEVDVRNAVGHIIQIVRAHGHAVRCKKVDLMPRYRAQRLTGGTLNRKTSAGRRVNPIPS